MMVGKSRKLLSSEDENFIIGEVDKLKKQALAHTLSEHEDTLSEKIVVAVKQMLGKFETLGD